MPKSEGQLGIEIVPVLADWACSDEGARLTALLGEFGMGKTVTCQMLNRHLLTRRETDRSTPLSLYFDLRDIEVSAVTGPSTLEKIIGDLLHRAGTTVLDANKVIAHIRNTASFVIFDGIDEVTNKLSAEQAIRFYRELLTIVPSEIWQADTERRRQIKIGSKDIPAPIKGPRILVSCRSHYFRDLATQRGFLIGLDRANVAADEDIQTYFMLPFTNQQIEHYLNFHLGDAEGARAWELIDETYNLKELAERPILLRFITETFSQLEEAKRNGQTVNIARLYDIFVDQSFTRDEPKHIIPIREKRRLLTDLAGELHRSGLSDLSHTALEDWFIDAAPGYARLATALSGTDGIRLSEIFLQDLRNATLLVRQSDHGFRFGHTSIREYFLADAIFKSIAAGIAATDLDMSMPSPETLSFILARLDIAEPRLSQNFNHRFPTLLSTGSPRAVRAIAFALWQRSEYRLPRPPILDLTDLDFFDTRFTGTTAKHIPLQQSRWHRARLNMVEFEHVDLTDADFSGVEARMAHILSCRLNRTLFCGADLQGSIWRHLDARSADFTGANLRDAHSHICQGLPGLLAKANPYTPLRSARLVRSTHIYSVNSVVIGKIAGRDVIVSGNDDGTVLLWDGISGAPIAALSGHTGWVKSVALGEVAGRSVVVSGSYDKSVRLWDAASGDTIAILCGHENLVASVTLGDVAGRSVIVSGSYDKTLRLWDAVSGDAITVLAADQSLVTSIAVGQVTGRSIIVSGSADGTIRLWDAISGDKIATWTGHTDRVTSVTLGEVAGRSIIVSGSHDQTVKLWDSETRDNVGICHGHTDWVTSVSNSSVAGRSLIVSGSHDRTVRLWDAETGDEVSIFAEHEGLVTSIALGTVGGRSIIVSGSTDRTIRLWDATSGEKIAVLEGHPGWSTSAALSRVSGRSIFVSGSYSPTLRLWDNASREFIAAMAKHGRSITSFTRGQVAGRDIIVSGGTDQTVQVSDAASRENIATLVGHKGWVTSVAIGDVAGRTIIVSGSHDRTVRLWDAETGNLVAILDGHKDFVTSVALGDIARRCIIVSASTDQTLQLWDAASGDRMATLIGHQGEVTSVALGHVAGRNIIVSGSEDQTVRLWDAISGATIATLAGYCGHVTSVAIDEVEAHIVVACVAGGTLHDVALNPHTFAIKSRNITGPRLNTRIETIPAPDGGDRIISASDDAWRYWRVQGRVEGRLVMRMIDDVVEPDAARA